VKLHAQGTLVPYREVRRARVYLRYENSPLVHRGASTAYRGRGSPLRSDRVVRGSLVVGAASARGRCVRYFFSWLASPQHSGVSRAVG
jgi:hypothetical protein